MLVELMIGAAIVIWLLFGLVRSSQRWWSRPPPPTTKDNSSNSSHRNDSTLAGARHKFTQRYRGRKNLKRIEEVLLPTTAVDSPYIFYMHFDRSMPIWTNLLTDSFKDDVDLLESEWYSIAKEYKSVRSSDVGWGTNTNDKGEQTWKVFHLMNQGSWVVANCDSCPQTVAILRRLSNIITNCLIGNVFFSVVPAGTVIAPHRGPTNARLRCHLGLEVPTSAQTGAWMDVGDESSSWICGHCVAFDDSYLHSGRYLNGDLEIAGLICDLWHPDLVKEERDCLQCVFGVD